MKSKFVKIYGRVQGVGFRSWTKKKADEFSLTGWVKNCEDSTVECEVCGEPKNVDLFLKSCLKGPLLSLVDKIDEKNIELKKYDFFKILY